ncbi:uncharacterized protein LOC118647366 [Monomorium pharaonis]|uniref:uncharacterized protein LOC118647366 n=1 Tax=Monomorium pharaonis TaxID=307658 RepID=UPI00174667A6|nr:uncharacterized protein LOC118647366 [Monomorium pharaonis]
MPVDHSPKHTSGSEKSGNTSPGDKQTTEDMQDNIISPVEIQANEFRNVKLAAFWRNRPKLWFAAIECEFTAYRIRSDEIKYSAVVRHLDEHSMIAVADILEQPPTIGKYETLKTTLIERFSDSLEKQMRTLLDATELGDKAPSVLLREMRTLAGTNVTDNMLRTLWLQRLPPRIQELLAVLDEVSLDKLAACADKAHDRGAGHGTIATTSVSQPDSMQTLNNQISKLTKSVAAIGKRRARSRSRGKTNKRSNSQDKVKDTSQTTCYYHRHFGEKAWKCLLPCDSKHPLAKRENSSSRRQ